MCVHATGGMGSSEDSGSPLSSVLVRERLSRVLDVYESSLVHFNKVHEGPGELAPRAIPGPADTGEPPAL
jgi:hypothetical protein